MYKFIKTRIEDEIGILTLDRPETINGWHQPMRMEVNDALKKFNADPKVRAIIITGAGDRAWSSGQDLAETMVIKGGEEGVKWANYWIEFYDVLRSMEKGVVAALNGVAAGSAYQYAMMCDVRVGHSGSRMGQPEINSGITSTTGPWIMYDRIGRSRTIELTLRGRMMNGDEAHEIGLIHYLVPQDQVMAKSMEIAKVLASKAPLAMKLTKQRFREMTEEGFRETTQANIAISKENYASGEPQQAMKEFFEERARRKAEREKAAGKSAAPAKKAAAKPAKKAAPKKAAKPAKKAKPAAKKARPAKKKAAPKRKVAAKAAKRGAAKRGAAKRPVARRAPARRPAKRKPTRRR
ncbi:MAG: enoyl-CoA hydratase/isomerase family protein [Alphaproteobacteria bacterium]